MVSEAIEYEFVGVCLPPFWIKRAKRELSRASVQLITVIGYPYGYNLTEVKMEEIQRAIDDGANELDVVVNLSAFRSGMPWAKIELAKCAKLIHKNGCLMKAVMTPEHLSEEEIVSTCKLCKEAGVDFVLTSNHNGTTKKLASQLNLMKHTLPDNVGVKVAGAFSSLSQVNRLIEQGVDRLGISAGVSLMEELNDREHS